MTKIVSSKVDYSLGSVMDVVELGVIGLPDLQRPFDWKNAKIRNLFDSMYRSNPFGYLLFWENAAAERTRDIGSNQKQRVPNFFIVDGQQRLTSFSDELPIGTTNLATLGDAVGDTAQTPAHPQVSCVSKR